MVVREDDRGCPGAERGAEHLARIHRAGIHASFRHPRVIQQYVPRIEGQDVEHLLAERPEGGCKVLVDFRGGAKPWALLAAQLGTTAKLQRSGKLGRARRTDSRDAEQFSRLAAGGLPAAWARREQG